LRTNFFFIDVDDMGAIVSYYDEERRNAGVFVDVEQGIDLYVPVTISRMSILFNVSPYDPLVFIAVPA